VLCDQGTVDAMVVRSRGSDWLEGLRKDKLELSVTSREGGIVSKLSMSDLDPPASA